MFIDRKYMFIHRKIPCTPWFKDKFLPLWLSIVFLLSLM